MRWEWSAKNTDYTSTRSYHSAMPRCFRLLLAISLLLSGQLAQADSNKVVRVAIFQDKGVAGKGVPRSMQFLTNAADIRVSKLNGAAIAAGALTNFDVVVFTGGSGSQQAASLGEAGREQVRTFVKQGGGYVGICAGAYLACSGFDWGLGILNAKTISPKWQRGKGFVQVEFAPVGKDVTGFNSGKHQVLYANGPVIRATSLTNLPPFETLAYFRTELAENGTPKGVMVDSPAIARARFGTGRIIFCSPHPEQTDGMEAFIESTVRWVSHSE